MADAQSAQNREQIDDPFLWLEAVHDPRAATWVDAQNARTTARFATSPQFAALRDGILAVLDSDERIPFVSRSGPHLYNYWQDAAHLRGVWRRTTLEEYQKAEPHWETLLDVDALSQAEGMPWVFKGARLLKPQLTRALILLSPDGGDAVEVREFDIPNRRFLPDGFHLPHAKSFVDWIDENTLYVATNFGSGSLTRSGYPRIVKSWTRGTPLEAAATVFEAQHDDVWVSAGRFRGATFTHNVVTVRKDFYRSVSYHHLDQRLKRIETPEDARLHVHDEWLLIELRSGWSVGGATYPAGTLLGTYFDAFMAGERNFEVLFAPEAGTSLASVHWTRRHLIVNILDDVKSRLEMRTPGSDGWQREPLSGAPPMCTVGVVATDPEQSDEYWLNVTGFLTPPSLLRGVLGKLDAVTVKKAPDVFDTSGLEVQQHFAVSKDGTRVPYFEVAPKGLALDGRHPTLLYGYGGFQISLTPSYSGVVGRAWLEKGGVYVVANIRGGGEYGPTWHQAALKAERPRAYEDFAAVADDLIRRGVTSPGHLGAMGGSNGGLLVGNMMTAYPKLFGAIACAVPLLDMRRYTRLDAGASWIAEYGDPDDPEQWAFIQRFSPYHNVSQNETYPPVLFYTARSDDRVGPVQARKMAAKMQEQRHPDVWFYENTEGGHGAAADHRQAASMWALSYSFLMEHLRA